MAEKKIVASVFNPLLALCSSCGADRFDALDAKGLNDCADRHDVGRPPAHTNIPSVDAPYRARAYAENRKALEKG